MNVIVKAVAGSHLFGLNTPKSDKDFKGVYLPEPRDIVLGRIQKSIHESTNPSDAKNNTDDIDCEFYSLDKFMKMLQEGQTVAIELLFTPEHQILEKSELWDEIVAMRDKLVHKKVTAFIGYAKTQADKYGIKGSRMGTVKNAIHLLDGGIIFEHYAAPLYQMWNRIEEFVENNEHTSIMQIPANKNMQNVLIDHWEICGRKFDRTCKIEYVRNILQKIYDGYGERAVQAMNNDGIDWKAVSHALRVCHQGIELLQSGKITLPLKRSVREFILKVKKGELDFTKEVQPVVESWMNSLQKAEKISTLREQLDNDFVDDFIYEKYREVIK